jgi:hypothetical protein
MRVTYLVFLDSERILLQSTIDLLNTLDGFGMLGLLNYSVGSNNDLKGIIKG